MMRFRPERAFIGGTVVASVLAFAINLVTQSWVVGHDWASVVASSAICSVALTFLLIVWLLASKNIDVQKPLHPHTTTILGAVFGVVLCFFAKSDGGGTAITDYLLLVAIFTACGVGMRFGFTKTKSKEGT